VNDAKTRFEQADPTRLIQFPARRMKPASCGFLCVLLIIGAAPLASAAVTISGAKVYQTIDGFGVDANHRSWNGTELQPVLNALIDQAGMTLFRVVYDKTDWEATNDNTDPATMNWTYYNTVYSSAGFTKLWNLVSYLNQRGIIDGIMFNFQGGGPSWMGGGYLSSGMESEWAEQIASMLYYARNTKGLKFTLVAPANEPDYVNEGISMDAATLATCLQRLAQRLDAVGMSDVRIVAPDLASGGTAYMPEILANSVIMGKLAHFGVHSYANGGFPGVYDYILRSAYPDRNFWVTEFNVWCGTCDWGVRGNYDWDFCRGTAENLFDHLSTGASAGFVWEGYDSEYLLHPPTTWSYWGLFSIDNEAAATKTYTPRKNFYTVAQISKFVRPGARRIDVSGSPFWRMQAYYHSTLGQLTIVGINPSSTPVTFDATLASLPALSGLDLYYTTPSVNMASGGRVAISGGAFTATIPGDCVFTLSGKPATTLTAPKNLRVVP
jgi:O-glycosyl hydrolase